jgi:hypothetical protein
MSKNAKKRNFKITVRQQQVFELWKEGATLRAIGEALRKQAEKAGQSTRGFSHEQVRKDLDHVLEIMRIDFEHELHTYRTMQLSRLNDQYMTFNAVAKGKIDKATGLRADPDAYAGRLVLGIIKETNEVLGIKAAIKHEITGKDGGPVHVMSSIDLSKLTTEELLQYEQLLNKANAS